MPTSSNFYIRRKSACACGGGCPRCSVVIQSKLKIGQPNDKYEQQADRVADTVVRMPEPKLQRQPEVEEEEEPLQTTPLLQTMPLIRRQPETEEEEETVQMQNRSEVLSRVSSCFNSHL